MLFYVTFPCTELKKHRTFLKTKKKKKNQWYINIIMYKTKGMSNSSHNSKRLIFCGDLILTRSFHREANLKHPLIFFFLMIWCIVETGKCFWSTLTCSHRLITPSMHTYIYMYYNIPNFRVHHGHLFNFQMFSSLDVWMA